MYLYCLPLGDHITTIIKKKVKTLLLPYISLGLLQYPVWLIANKKATNKIEPLMNLFTFNTNEVMPMAGALWFLTCLFFAELIYIIIDKYATTFKRKGLVIACIALFGNLFTTLFGVRLPLAIDTSFVATGFIFLGNVARINSSNNKIKQLFHMRPFPLVLLIVLNTFFCFLNGGINMRTGHYSIIPLFWLNALTAIIVYWNLSIFLCNIMANNNIIWFKREIIDIGKNSIIYLCLNQTVIWGVSTLLRKLGLLPASWGFKCLIVMLISLVILKFAERIIIHSQLRVLFGKM